MKGHFHKITEKNWGIISLFTEPRLSGGFCSLLPDPAQGLSDISVSEVSCLGKRFDNNSFVIWVTFVSIARKKCSCDWSVRNDGKTKQMHDYEFNISSEMNHHVCVPWTAKLCSGAMSLLKQKLQAITHLSWVMGPMSLHVWMLRLLRTWCWTEVSNWMLFFELKTLIWPVWDAGSQLWRPLCYRNAVNIFTVC